MRALALAAASALAFAATPAFAQDSGDEPFTGFYVGGSVGYSFQNNDVGETILFDRNLDGIYADTVTTTTSANAFSPGFCNGAANTNAPAGGCLNDKDDIEYHLRFGYDRQMGNIVVGVLGEIGKSEVRDSVTGFSTTPASYTMTRELDWNASIRGRVGFAANTTLFYATGGVTYGRIDNSFTTTNGANSFTLREAKDDSWGAQFGGGIEQKIGRNFSVGVEYLYTRFRDDDFRVRAGAGTAPATNPFLLGAGATDFRRSDPRFDYHSVRLTAAFRF